MCCLIRKGIIQAPSEFSRKKSTADEASTKEAALNAMFGRLRETLHFGSFALLRVNPAENFGQELVPVAIGRKAPCEWSAQSARDGMFDHGDLMVFIYEFEQQPGGEFEIPSLLPGDETRAVPIKCLAGPGQGIRGYLKPVSVLGGPNVPAIRRYRLRRGVVAEGRSNLVRMSVEPTSAFQDVNLAKLSASDRARAPIMPSLFPVNTVIRRGFRAPTWGNSQRAWSGLKKLDARVVEIATPGDRRHRYRLRWSGDARTLVLANVPEDVDEGYVQKFLLSQPS